MKIGLVSEGCPPQAGRGGLGIQTHLKSHGSARPVLDELGSGRTAKSGDSGGDADPDRLR